MGFYQPRLHPFNQADVDTEGCKGLAGRGAAAFTSHRLPCSPGEQGPGGITARLAACSILAFLINKVASRPVRAAPTFTMTWYISRKWHSEIKTNSKVLLPGLGLRETSGPALYRYLYRLLPRAAFPTSCNS